MGTDICTKIEIKQNNCWIDYEGKFDWLDEETIKTYKENYDEEYEPASSPFTWRDYSIFGFLANARNYSNVTPLAPLKGIPKQATFETRLRFKHQDSVTYYTLEELNDFDYTQIMEDCRYTQQVGQNCFDGAATTYKGNGIKQTYIKFLGQSYFDDIETLKDIAHQNNIEYKDVRVIIGFCD